MSMNRLYALDRPLGSPPSPPPLKRSRCKEVKVFKSEQQSRSQDNANTNLTQRKQPAQDPAIEELCLRIVVVLLMLLQGKGVERAKKSEFTTS